MCAHARVCVGGACVRVCVKKSFRWRNYFKCVWLHRREVMCMAEATNEGVRDRRCPWRGKRRCVHVRGVDIERTCLFERHR